MEEKKHWGRDMKVIFSADNTGPNKQKIHEELLEHLKRFEDEGWLVLGIHHMNLKKRKWLNRPEKLAESSYYKALKGWLKNSSVPVPQKSSLYGLVRYHGLDGTDAKDFVESVFFDLILAKDNEIAMVSYGKHKFNNEAVESMLGRTGYNVVIFKINDWKDILLIFLSKYKDPE